MSHREGQLYRRSLNTFIIIPILLIILIINIHEDIVLLHQGIFSLILFVVLIIKERIKEDPQIIHQRKPNINIGIILVISEIDQDSLDHIYKWIKK